MSRRIVEVQLSIAENLKNGKVDVSLTKGADILGVGVDIYNTPVLYAVIDTEAVSGEKRTYRLIESGKAINDSVYAYIGTIDIAHTVYHIFEV